MPEPPVALVEPLVADRGVDLDPEPVEHELKRVKQVGLVAVDDLSFSARRGQVTALIGPSGCGKTTLLKSFNRFLELTDDTRVQGHILIDDQDIYAPGVDVTEIRKKTGLLAQRPFPLPMSIRDNVAYGMKIHGTKKGKEVDRAVQHYLEMAGLWDEVKDRLHDSALGLSGGQQQRLCIARAMAVEPEVLLMDEPASALDPIATQKIEDLISQLKESYTIIIVTHNMQQAARISEHPAFMYLGDLVEYGPTARILLGWQGESSLTSDSGATGPPRMNSPKGSPWIEPT